MNYIFPKNYNFKNKIMGIIDYSTAIFNIIVLFLIVSLGNILFIKITNKLIFIIILYLPIFLFSIVGFNNENILYICYYIIKYLLKPKVYLYK